MDVSVRLANEELWTKFHANTTEMVVTKTGRKMFPKLEYTIEGLKANLAYGLVLQIEQVDDNRYKFSGGEWSAAGRGESGGVPKNVMHHDGVMPGSHWMRQTVNFERVKITNNLNDANPSHSKKKKDSSSAGVAPAQHITTQFGCVNYSWCRSARSPPPLPPAYLLTSVCCDYGKNQPNPNNAYVMESFDVTALYTNVSNDSALQATHELLIQHLGAVNMYGLSIEQFMVLQKSA
ncbi:hypothetical protein KIN20_032346 [Parelaphostrongylus tenuis]|uniref:T-box domain-containing protein n=1 Tax=Parelaphostrongylus tenuis TaxID=148309 RepID=A0AAD5R730_PARTN|nr:hypothetical protein KIN20_032346 [Parelaphostrongylus tenuis]